MKAVIMAGGEGSRLRPLTCTLPKPMAKIMGKPIIEYIFDLLSSHGITQAAVTLGYMPHVIEKQYESGYKNLTLNFIREDTPLGTAGSVKNAAADFEEPFIVISGDAMCDFDIQKILTYHKAAGAMITIVATDSADPREYGVIKVDRENRVVGFIEKPTWNQAISSLANTGVYIINPECLKLIPKGQKYDFAADLFPLMLERDMPIFCYHTSDYWCDVGNIESYLKCHRDLFDGKLKPPVSSVASGIYTKKELPKGDYSVIPPIYIGDDVEIADGAVIGPYAVIDDKCSVGANSAVRHSVILENSWLGNETKVTGALVCSGSSLKKGAAMFENSVAGSGCVIGENASIKPNILVWPGKIVGSGASVSSNVKYGSIKAEYLSENGMSEKSGVRLNAETCVRLGCAIGSTKSGKKTGIANDGSKSAELMQLAVTAGLSSSGALVWNFGECFEAQLNFLVNFCGLESGIFISGLPEKEIKIFGEGGLSITRSFEREIEKSMTKCEFHETPDDEIKEISDMSSVKLLYNQELLKQAENGLQGIGVSFESQNEAVKSLLTACASRLGAHESDELVLVVNESGTELTAHFRGEKFEHEKLLAVCCKNELMNGKNIAVPYDAPAYLDILAERCGRKVLRYLSSPADSSDLNARKLAANQIFVRDALFLAFKLLSILKNRECGIDELVDELPEKYIVRKKITINFAPTYLATVIGEETVSAKNDFEGIKLIKNGGRLLLIPEKDGENVRILAESDSMEAAEELCADIEELIGTANEKQN